MAFDDVLETFLGKRSNWSARCCRCCVRSRGRCVPRESRLLNLKRRGEINSSDADFGPKERSTNPCDTTDDCRELERRITDLNGDVAKQSDVVCNIVPIGPSRVLLGDDCVFEV